MAVQKQAVVELVQRHRGQGRTIGDGRGPQGRVDGVGQRDCPVGQMRVAVNELPPTDFADEQVAVEQPRHRERDHHGVS